MSLSIAPGETYGLLGPNGAGKTTTIRMVCGLLRPHAGTVRVAGQPVSTGAGPAKRLIGFVPQDVALYPDLSVRENLRFFGRLYRLPRRQRERRVDEVLDLIDLSARAGDRVDSLSGGMRRRLNIGAGLVHAPTLLVLDEPTVGVDPQSRHAILESVHRFGEEGMAVLYTTHYMEEAERLCDRVGIIDRGRLVAEGRPVSWWRWWPSATGYGSRPSATRRRTRRPAVGSHGSRAWRVPASAAMWSRWSSGTPAVCCRTCSTSPTSRASTSGASRSTSPTSKRSSCT